MPNRVSGHVRALELESPRRLVGGEPRVQRLERDKRLGRQVALGHGDEVDIASVGLELAKGDGAVEIESHQAAPEDALDVGQKAIEQRVSVGLLRGAMTQRANDSKTGRMRSRAVFRFASELA